MWSPTAEVPVLLSRYHWTAPEAGFIKLNFDGAFDCSARLAGAGGVMRNEEGHLILAFAEAVRAPHPPEAELKVLFQGVKLAKTIGITKQILEGDSLILVENVQREGALSCDWMPSWKNLLAVLEPGRAWRKEKILFCRRSENRLADALAKMRPPPVAMFHSYLTWNHLLAKNR